MGVRDVGKVNRSLFHLFVVFVCLDIFVWTTLFSFAIFVHDNICIKYYIAILLKLNRIINVISYFQFCPTNLFSLFPVLSYSQFCHIRKCYTIFRFLTYPFLYCSTNIVLFLVFSYFKVCCYFKFCRIPILVIFKFLSYIQFFPATSTGEAVASLVFRWTRQTTLVTTQQYIRN